MTQTTTPDTPLEFGREGAVAMLRFNRPAALNAIDVPMAHAFLAAVRAIAADRSVRAVLMSGAGKGFMAGGDLALLSADPQGGAAAL
ncbi:enoyl-CoA hydratase/isomerase family protein, partial [Variovorax paradoxus]|uniref:enoyl-CoA hydratase/isomerase family protein n=1 Tax=Variovorax paradoxus TaxID=34073 RepID=UPI001ABC6EA8